MTTIRCRIIPSAAIITGALLCAFGDQRSIMDSCRPFSSSRSGRTSRPVCLCLTDCRQLLVVIPASLQEHPRIVDLLRDGETIPRLRCVHEAFDEALRREQVTRETDSLDP